jgi:hypothetical protein
VQLVFCQLRSECNEDEAMGLLQYCAASLRQPGDGAEAELGVEFSGSLPSSIE